MRKFTKKPVTIEAVQWHGDAESLAKIREFCGPSLWAPGYAQPSFLTITTLEGEMKATPGDWIIKGVKGEFYPCKPDIFRETYQPADADHMASLPPAESEQRAAGVPRSPGCGFNSCPSCGVHAT